MSAVPGQPPTDVEDGGTWPPVAAVALAGSFLTVLPFPSGPFGRRAVSLGVALFPAIGIALGGALGALGLALDLVLPATVTAALLLAAGTVVTGGLHLDGLMDSADGVFGSSIVERRLEIMRDSRVGSFGVLAGVLALLAEFAALSQLVGTRRLTALILAFGLSRWALTLALGVFPAARPTGLGTTVRAGAGGLPVVVATLIAVGLAAANGLQGFIGLFTTVAIVVAGGRFLALRLGGLTGDTYGALAVVSEAGVLVVSVALRTNG